MMHPALLQSVVVVLAGTGTGVLGALLGTGGGVLLIPILVLGLGIPMHHAVATSIVSVVATSSAVASANVERGVANMRLGMTLEIATATGAIVGGIIAEWIAPHRLEILFAIVLVPTAVLMWRGRTGHQPQPQTADTRTATVAPTGDSLGELGGHYYDDAEARTVSYQVHNLSAGLAISLVAGSLSGLLGIGGGVFKVPALHLFCGVPMKAAAATSNFMIGVTAAASAFLYYGRGEVRLMLTAGTVLGVLAGSALGTRLNRHVRGAAARRLFAALLMAVALQMLYNAWRGA